MATLGATPSTTEFPTGFETTLWKSYFTTHSLMPATTYKEELYAYPARDFSNLNGGSLTVNRNRAKFISSGANIANWGWDVGGLKTKMLWFTRAQVAVGSDFSIFIADTTPSASEVANGTYMWNITTSTSTMYKRAAGSFTSLGADTTAGIPLGAGGMEIGVGIYYDDTSGTLIGFLQKGHSAPVPVIDITDSTFTTMRYAGIRTGGVSTTYWANTPVWLMYTA